jgi:uncharacterized membrane-anchored protein
MKTMNLLNRLLLFGFFSVILAPFSVLAQDAENGPRLNIAYGPTNVHLGTVAEVKVPGGYVFLDGESTRALLKAGGEPVSGDELGMIKATNQQWSVFFEFSDVGYIKDDEKDKLDPDKLLAAIKRGNDEANKHRQQAGKPPLEIVGWEIPPKYDPNTHNLEWAIRATSEGRPILNYNTRLLGRRGVMEVVLVVAPDHLSETLPSFRSLMTGYQFQSGGSYAEYRPGDKVAKYGLGALVVGGAAVGAAKLGLFSALAVFIKKAWKLVVVAVVAVLGGVKKLFGGGKSQAPTE